MNVDKIQIKERGNGDLYFELPDTLLDRLGWVEGDDIKFTPEEGGFKLSKVKYETIELNLDEDELFKYMKAAHEAHMSFDEWVQHAINSVIQQLDYENKPKRDRDIAQSG